MDRGLHDESRSGKDFDRFTVKPNDFYITALQWPGAKLTVSAPVPIKPGDRVNLLGYSAPLSWTKTADGKLEITTPTAGEKSVKNREAFVFRIHAAQAAGQPATRKVSPGGATGSGGLPATGSSPVVTALGALLVLAVAGIRRVSRR